MTIDLDELIERLEELRDESDERIKVQVAIQPNLPLVGDVVDVHLSSATGEPVVYIASRADGYLAGAVGSELRTRGWELWRPSYSS
jgi:hypothetical protein